MVEWLEILILIWDILCSNFGLEKVIMTEVSYGFSQSLQANTAIN
jgi:hypothetical protein